MDAHHHRLAVSSCAGGTSTLPSAADGLLASLQRAQAELDLISSKLEEEFALKYKGGAVNPLTILTRLNKLRRELPLVHEECKAVLAAKQEVVDAAKQQLVGNTQLLRQLQRRAGIEAAEGGSGGEVEAAFTAAVAEHEAKLRVQYAGDFADEFNREELKQAYVDSQFV